MRTQLSASAAASLVLLAAAGIAEARPSTVAMSCAQARAIVQREGAAVLGTGGQTYDRYVRDRNFCEPTEIGKTAFVPARDTPSCFVGYTCYEPGQSDRFGDF